jgi:formylglycine-generating enzyme
MMAQASSHMKWLWACCAGAAIGCGGGTQTSAPTGDPALPVPAQSFTLGGDVASPTSAATVSAFSLDAHEVTVGRFQAFAAAYDAWRAAGNPKAGAGAHPLIPDSGWRDEWSASLAATAADLTGDAGGVRCGSFATWDAADPELPINCVSWFDAFAFCAWAERRLPTEAEWEAAASGGDEGRPLPWGTSPPDATRAVYDCTGDGSAAGDCALSDILHVGSKPAGAGRWGHLDLAGSVWEWVLDWYAAYPPISNDSANLTAGSYRVIRSSGWYSNADDLRVAIRYSLDPTARRGEFGFRCALSR